MLKLKTVKWADTVLPTWNSNHPNFVEPNKQIWSQFPDDLVWCSARLESNDINHLYIIGSLDWLQLFETLRLDKVCQCVDSGQDREDPHHHIERIKALQSFYATGKTLAPIIVIAVEDAGPFIIVDGNHRACALWLNNTLDGQEVLLGVSKSIPTHVDFYQHSISN